ncbi:MAG: Na+/H+ antiporter NhaC family protein [Cellulosilyticaceae bacterium]
MKKLHNKGNPWALLPIGIFLIIFIGTGVVTKDFYKMPVLVAFMIAATVALAMKPKVSLHDKLEIFCKGAGNNNIIMMCLIFLLAGAFSSVAKEMGAVEATVNLSLNILPPKLLVPGLFIIGCFISIAMGTSVGTITALTPIGLGIAEMTGIPAPLIIGAIISGGMFGDNLSMISDTTIAAVRTQGCELKDKFKVNFFIVLPAAIITFIMLTVMSLNANPVAAMHYDVEIIKIIPYVGILIGALAGVNVFVLLGSGIVVSGLIGIFGGTFDVYTLASTVSTGMIGMEDLAMLSLVVGGTLEIIKANGGIDYLMHFITSRIHSKKGAEFGIAMLVSIVDICTANNTIAIVVAGPVAKEIAEEYEIDPRKTASILDIFSACWQGIIPYGAQVLAAAGLAAISPMELLGYLHYPMLMGICGLLAIAFGFPKLKFNQTNKA